MSPTNATTTITASDIAYIRKGVRAAGLDDSLIQDDTIRDIAMLRLMAVEAASAAAVKKADVTQRVRLNKGDAADGTRPSATPQHLADRLRAVAQHLSQNGPASYGDTVRRLVARQYPGGVASQSADARLTPPTIVSGGAQRGDGLLPLPSRGSTTSVPRP